MTKVAVLGGGIVGLFASIFIKNFDPTSEVQIIESSAELGGLLKPINVLGKPIDQGVHTFYETGIQEVDKLIFSVIPSGGWKILEGHKRDLGGAISQEGLLLGNHYLRPPNNFHKSNSTFKLFESESSTNLDETNLASWIISRYGRTIAQEIVKPYVEKFLGEEWSDASVEIRNILPLERMNLVNQSDYSKDIYQNEMFRARIAIPDQRSLPKEFLSTRKAYYPKQYGSFRFIDAIINQLLELEVEISTNSTAKILDSGLLQINSRSELKHFDLIISTLSLPITYSLLGMNPNSFKKRKTVIASVITTELPNVEDLYYAYDYRTENRMFRLGFPHNYSDNQPFSDNYLISCEYICNKDEFLKPKEVLADLKGIILNDLAKVSHVDIQEIMGGYPAPTVHLEDFLSLNSNEFTRAAKSKNVLHLGIGSNGGLFRQHDLLANAFAELKKSLISSIK